MQDFEIGQISNQYINNEIRTRKYTLMNFIFRFIFEQFTKGPNVYFILVAIIQHTDASIARYYSTLTGIALLEFVFLIKECLEDRKRYNFDNVENYKKYSVYDQSTRSFKAENSYSIRVGNIIRLDENDCLPSDMIILHSSHANGNVYMTTAAIDGESGVKCFHDLNIIDHNKNLIDELDKHIVGKKCERSPPSNRIQEMKIFFDSKQVDPNSIALRGFNILHTKHVYGIVTHTGKDTTMMQNVSGVQSKMSRLDERVNTITFYSIIATFLLTLGSAIPVYFHRDDIILDKNLDTDFKDNLFGFFVVYSGLTPLSIFSFVVVFEFIMKFNIDHDHNFGGNVCVNNENSLPDFGAVNVICTDKTGTLTQNIMRTENLIVAKYSGGKNGDKQSPTGAQILRIETQIGSESVPEEFRDFLTTVLMCNSSNLNPTQKITEGTNTAEIGKSYLSTNQDDESLLKAAGECHSIILEKSEKSQKIRLFDGKERNFVLLPDNSLEFDHNNRFAAVVCYDTEDKKYYAYLKGAYDKLYQMIDRRTIPKDIDIKLEVFYQKCYRILCFCFARFDKLPSRREIMDYKRYKFVALSGTKDELAKGVKSTIRSLKAANIKIIMLTGDHPKTAKNIALSCDLASLTDECVLSKDNYKQYITNTNYIDFLLLNQMKHNEYAVFDAEMTKHVLKSPLQFLKWSKESKCIVFSRSTPDTKARVVDMYQSDKSQYIHASGHTNIVLAIGDGANDVAMLRRASLAVGIVGHEGRIAASSSDIAVDSFYRLQRLVLVHGAWNYLRGTLGILIFLYKNLAFSVPVLLYICFSDFSVAKIFDDWLMIGVVFFFTSFSLLPISSIDHQISDEKRLQYPVLYQASLSRKNYTAATIFEWLQAAFIHGSIPFLIIFFGANYFPFSTHYGKLINYQYLSIMTCLTTLIVVHAKIQLMMRHISLLSCILTQSSFVFFIIFLFLPIFNDPINRGYVKEVFLSWESYILIFLILFICLYRDLIWVWFKRMYWEHISLIYDNRKGLHKRLEMKPIRVLKNNLQRSTGQN